MRNVGEPEASTDDVGKDSLISYSSLEAKN